MTRRLMAIGECMVEMAPRPGGGYDMGFAGDSFNTAWYARRSAGGELQVAYLSAIGDDAASGQMRAFMAGAGIEPILKVRLGRAAGLYLISLSEGERSFSYWRDTSAARTLADDLEALPQLGAGDIAFFSGITLAILPEAGRTRLLSVLGAAAERGVRVAFDPNLRPRLWASGPEMCDWIMRGAAVAQIALPSFEDEAGHFGDADPEATARRYEAAGVQMVVVKDGPEPVTLADGGVRVLVAPPEGAEVVDTTAAGDSFNGRFLAGLLAGEAPEVAAAAACQLSARVIGARGALVDVPVPRVRA